MTFRGLFLDGTAWATTSNPDITGDLTVEIELWKENWTTASSEDLAAVYEGASQHSWIVEITSLGFLKFWWSEDGSNNLSVTSTTLISDLMDSEEEFIALKIEVDVDPGDITFYHWNGTTWVQYYTENVGIISLFSSTADLEVGSRNAGFTARTANAVVKYLKVYSGISTGIVVDALFENEARGTTSFTDEQANVWTLSDNAVIVDGQTPELGLHLPEPTEVAKDWAVTVETSRLNAEAIDTFVGALELNQQDAVIDNSQSEGPFDADDSQKVKWRVINGIVFAWWDIFFGPNHNVDPTGRIEIDLPVAADTSFHNVDEELGVADTIGEGHLYDNSSAGNRQLCSIQLLSGSKIRINLEGGNPIRQLTGDDPFLLATGDSWAFNGVYKAAT